MNTDTTTSIGGLIGFIIGFSIGVVFAVYIWMLIFVYWLKYDYVTVSSVFFALNFVGGIFYAIGAFQSADNSAVRVLALVVWLLLYPLLVSSGLNIYEAWNHPGISLATNLVGWYRTLAGYPIGLARSALVSAVPAVNGAVASIERSPLLTQVVASSITGLLAWLVGRGSRLASAG